MRSRACALVVALLGPAAVAAPPGSAAPATGEAEPPAQKALAVVIDPGHGGSNTGAPGRQGASEKQITLAIARLLRKRLHQKGIEAMLTRDRDVYVTLGERMRRANSFGGDLFLSIHGNSSPEHALRGPEAYIIAREVADVAAERASSEAPSAVEGMRARAQVRKVAAESARLARVIERRLGVARDTEDRRVHQAAFDVLDGVEVPAALIEVGYVDHPVEGEELLDLDVLGRIADAIADGIEDFVAHREPPRPRAATPEPAAAPQPLPAKKHKLSRERPAGDAVRKGRSPKRARSRA